MSSKLLTSELIDIVLTHAIFQSQLLLGDYFKIYGLADETAEIATELLGWILHSGVCIIFDEAQKLGLQMDDPEKILSYLVANLTQWTTHNRVA